MCGIYGGSEASSSLSHLMRIVKDGGRFMMSVLVRPVEDQMPHHYS